MIYLKLNLNVLDYQFIMNQKIDFLTDKLRNYCNYHVSIDDPESLAKIYDLFHSEKIFQPENGIECLYCAMFFECIKKDFTNVEHYYLMAIDHGEANAKDFLAIYYCNLAIHYDKIKNYKKMKHYYLMAIKYGHYDAMNNYGVYCGDVKKDYVNAVKYYLMAIEYDVVNAMFNLGNYYEIIEKNNKRAERYYLMAIDHGCVDSFNILIKCEHYKQNRLKKTELYIKYYSMTTRKKIICNIEKLWNSVLSSEQTKCFVKILLSYDFISDDNIPTSLTVFINLLKQKIKLIKLHFDYAIDSKGYVNAKQNFTNLIKN